MDVAQLLLLTLVGINALSFLFMGWDKLAAQWQVRRLPEHWFHKLALFGAWPGLVLSILIFRHKLRKVRFLWMLATYTAFNLAFCFGIFFFFFGTHQP